ncbi:MAG: HAD hydrolase-like protein [Patescibacteria group bacterium]|jgi:phosphoglycolate phosphatase-like HAD superfamily hydrolase
MNLFLDIDGPILDVSDRYYRVYQDFCDKNQLVPSTKKKFWQTKRAKKDINIPDKLRADFRDYWAKVIESPAYTKFDQIQLGAITALDKLSQHNNLFAVSLRQDSKTEMSILKQFGIVEYFCQIFIASPALFQSENNWKIKRDLIADIANHNDMIAGDTGTDIKCGQNLGLKTVAVLSGISNRQILTRYKPDYITDNITTLVQLLEREKL